MNVKDLLARARIAFRIGDTRLAEHLLKQALDAKPRLAQAHNLLGLVYNRMGGHRQAVECFRRAIELKKNYGEAYNNLGVALRKLERYDEAIASFGKAFHHCRNPADIHYNLGNVFKSLGGNEKAIEEFSRAISIDPGFTPAYNNLGTAYEQSGRLGEAVAAYRRGLEVDANQPHLHYNLGIALQKSGNLREAQLEFEHALRVRPGWVEALNNLGVVYQLQGEHRKAIRVLQELLRIDPDNLQARNNLGVVYAELGASEQAVQYYRDALKINPGYAPAASNLGSLFEKGGSLSETEEAAALLKENLARQPNHLPTLRALARFHQQQGRNKEAEGFYRKLLELDPGNNEYLLDIAAGAWKRGDLERAERELKRYLERVPCDLDVRLRLGELYLQRSNLRQAVALVKEALERQPDNVKAHELLARAYRKMGEPHQALEALENAVTLQGSGSAGQDLSRLGETLEMYEEAVSEYGRPHREQWASNLERLQQLGRRKSGAQPALSPDIPPPAGIMEEEEVPVIDIGGREPVLAVSEAEERIDLDEIEAKPLPPSSPVEPVVSLRDETPMPLISLLDGQSLYEENPNWQEYRPPPFARDTGPGSEENLPERGQPLSDRRLVQRTAAAPSFSPPPPPAPSPGRGDMLAESLRESVRAQGETMRHPEDELPELPRRTRMPPQYVPVPPYPAAAPPSYPQRWPEATSAPASPRQRWPEAAPAPPPLPPHPPGEPVFVRPESLEDIPRYVRDDEEAEGEAGAEESAGRGGSEGEIVVQETSEDFLEKGVEEEPTVGLRQRLRDFLRRIRERLEQKPVAELEEEPLPVPEPGRQAGLLGYLEELAEYLPEQEKSGFLRSDARLKIEYIKAKLQGKVGVKRRIETGYTPPSPPAPERSSRQGELSMEEIADTFAFIGTLAAHHPDKNLGTMLQSKVKGIVQRIKS